MLGDSASILDRLEHSDLQHKSDVCVNNTIKPLFDKLVCDIKFPIMKPFATKTTLPVKHVIHLDYHKSIQTNQNEYIESASQTKIYGCDFDDLLDRFFTFLIFQPDRDHDWLIRLYSAFIEIKY